jgi:uncharacterized protein (TIGR03435 family)
MLAHTACKPHFKRMLLLIAGLIAAGLPGMGQSGAMPSRATDNATKSPAFEVVSVRPNKSGQGFGMNFTPNGFIATNMPLQPVIVMAYNLRDPKLRLGGEAIPGAPKWINSDPYDIQAKISNSDLGELNKFGAEQQLAQKRLMLRAMLADRFKLKIHHETKQGPCYVLVAGKNGSEMKEAKSIDPAFPDGKLFAQPGAITAQGVSLSGLAFALTMPLDCPVQDKTGLAGRYDFTLQYAPDLGSGPMPMPPSGQRESASPPDASGPSLFTAVREQLGLRLIPATAPVDSIVIDHVEKPSEN